MSSIPLALFALVLSTSVMSAAGPCYQQTGTCSWYGSENRRAASGEVNRPSDMTAAHRTLPLGSKIKVTNLANNRAVVLRVNDRGPFCKKRVLDVSRAAAQELQMMRAGTCRVKVELVASN